MKIKTHLNYSHEKERKEIHRGESQTVQNDAYSISELLQRHISGMLDIRQNQKLPQYQENPDFDNTPLGTDPTFTKMDAIESILNTKEKLTSSKKGKILAEQTTQEEINDKGGTTAEAKPSVVEA